MATCTPAMEALRRSGLGVPLSVHREIWCPPAGTFLSAYRENDVSAVTINQRVVPFLIIAPGPFPLDVRSSSLSASSTSQSNNPAAALDTKGATACDRYGAEPSSGHGVSGRSRDHQEHQMMTHSGMAMHPHGIGFEYTVTGVHTVPTSAGGSQDVPAGHATFIGPDIVPNIMSPSRGDWYLVSDSDSTCCPTPCLSECDAGV